MASKTLTLTDQLYDYLLAVSLREPDVLRRLRQETAQDPMARMQISPEQGQFMALLVQLMGARRVLEIGTFTGYSTLAVALALPEEGRVVAMDVSRVWTDVGRRFWREAGVDDRIDLRVGPAAETLASLLAAGDAASFDFAFIDADKIHYDLYYERVLELLRPGGLVVIDNVLWSGRVADPTDQDEDTVALRQLNAKLHQDERVALSQLPLGDGITLALKRR